MSNDEKRDIEDRINDAMAKIVSDTVGEPQPENKKNRSAAHKSARPSKSARPRKITYVPIDESEFEPIVIPEKKKHKALKVTGMIAAMVLVVAGCAYAGVSYYYTSHFFEGTTINGIDSSNRTAYEVEQEIAKKMEGYSIQVKARDQEPQTIEGTDISYRYISSGEVLKLLKAQKPYEWVRGFFEKTTYTASEQTAFEMASGLRERSGADIAVATTGIAGPGGGTKEKPVGLVYVACADKDGVKVERLQLGGDRMRVRRLATLKALDMVRRAAIRG